MEANKHCTPPRHVRQEEGVNTSPPSYELQERTGSFSVTSPKKINEKIKDGLLQVGKVLLQFVVVYSQLSRHSKGKVDSLEPSSLREVIIQLDAISDFPDKVFFVATTKFENPAYHQMILFMKGVKECLVFRSNKARCDLVDVSSSCPMLQNSVMDALVWTLQMTTTLAQTCEETQSVQMLKLGGWEGSANDVRVFSSTLSDPRNHFPWPPIGKYYVVHSGYVNITGKRYHIPEWIGMNRDLTNAWELYSKRHAIVHNGLISNYKLERHVNILILCCVAHNFIKRWGQIEQSLTFNDPDWQPNHGSDDQTTPFINTTDTTLTGLSEQYALMNSIATTLQENR
ncbi:transposon protein [Striga asiatica]|uniref:Transposon protein n=1 Tax=Striga asiatica TaxID=4170 RepID=A0A5A7RCU0_STRAF|nr:transposon protein [Striga asiatica]